MNDTARTAWLLAGVLLLAGCAPRPLVARAIRARGGPLHSLVREVEAEVRMGIPATWRWRTVFLLPDRYAWTIYTTGEPDHYLTDGRTTRAFVGSRLVTEEAGPTALRTHARFTAVQNLDALLLPGVAVEALAAGDLPAGTTAGLAVVFADDGARYRLGFDAQDRLVYVAGALALPPFADGQVEARVTEFRRVQGLELPSRTTYRIGERVLSEERTLAACPDPPGLDASVFAAPAALPTCEVPPAS